MVIVRRRPRKPRGEIGGDFAVDVRAATCRMLRRNLWTPINDPITKLHRQEGWMDLYEMRIF